MPNLIHRTEQALLGALIYDPSLTIDVPYLLPRHFEHPEHQAIYAALLAVRANEPTATGVVLAERIAFQTGLATVTEASLTGMALASPDVSSVAVYGRMIQEAGLYRSLAEHAERLAQAAGPVRGVDPELDHFDALSRALGRHATGYYATFEAALTTQSPAQITREDLQTLREEQVLADLVQNPHVLTEVVDWLDPQVFTSPDRRQIYEAIVAVDGYGEPVEELTLAWQLARSHTNQMSMHPGRDTVRQEQLAGPGYLERLARMSVETGVAIEIGRDLLAEHTTAQLTAKTPDLSLVHARTADRTQQRELTQQRQPTQERQATLEAVPEVTREVAPILAPSPDRTLGLNGPELRY
jgi:hypothetical protein